MLKSYTVTGRILESHLGVVEIQVIVTNVREAKDRKNIRYHIRKRRKKGILCEWDLQNFTRFVNYRQGNTYEEGHGSCEMGQRGKERAVRNGLIKDQKTRVENTIGRLELLNYKGDTLGTLISDIRYNIKRRVTI